VALLVVASCKAASAAAAVVTGRGVTFLYTSSNRVRKTTDLR
jgi:hypothetical protein